MNAPPGERQGAINSGRFRIADVAAPFKCKRVESLCKRGDFGDNRGADEMPG
jgi:hypothetical protein